MATLQNRKPLRCRFGFHDMYMDAAFFSSTQRCNNCGVSKDPAATKQLERERQAWRDTEGVTPRARRLDEVRLRTFRTK